ncbi:MAG: chloride channel protein, partial [Breznakibacter sp.]|nr:chloride channel protein [Breznakibacter sp.]
MLDKFPKSLFTLKWLAIALIVGTLAGLSSALFLISLDWVTKFREEHLYLIYLLPIAGVAIAAMYHYFGQDVAKGNNQLIEEVENPQNTIPLKMAPFVLIGTLVTHLFGGSAGREGTAVQMGGSLADQLSTFVKFSKANRRILIVTGISGGFAAVFGTPLAATVFALEVLVIGQLRYDALVPALLSALIAYWVCNLIPWVHHTHYYIGDIPPFSPIT